MSIRPVEFNGMIQRTEDVSSIKHQEDSKSHLDQQNIQSQVERKEDAVRHQVLNKDNSSQTKNDADARDEGRGVYYTPSRKNKKKGEEKPKTERVVPKYSAGRFDMKI